MKRIAQNTFLRYRRAIFKHTPEVCGICGEGPRAKDPWTIDHKKPRAAGGTDAYSNLQRAHRKCNEEKADTWPWPPVPAVHSFKVRSLGEALQK